jgi:hypothetical protein
VQSVPRGLVRCHGPSHVARVPGCLVQFVDLPRRELLGYCARLRHVRSCTVAGQVHAATRADMRGYFNVSNTSVRIRQEDHRRDAAGRVVAPTSDRRLDARCDHQRSAFESSRLLVI